MILDDTLIKMFTQIKEEVKAKYNVEYSIEEIHSIVDVQIEATKVGISKGITVIWHRFCKFVFTNKYVRKEEVKLYQNHIDSIEDLSQEEKDKLKYDKVIESARQKKNHKANSKKVTGNQDTVETLIATPNVNNITLKKFVCLTKSR
jgi:hypothetical protein